MRRTLVGIVAGWVVLMHAPSAMATVEPSGAPSSSDAKAKEETSTAQPTAEASGEPPVSDPSPDSAPPVIGPTRPAPAPVVNPRVMRSPFAPSPRLPSLRSDRDAAATSNVQSLSDLGLVRQEDGSFLYRDPGRRFTARILADGRVRFADRWRRPTPTDPGRSDRGRCCGAPPEGLGRALNPFMGIPGSGPTEWAVRRGARQANAEAKAALLRRTEAFRAQLSVAAYRDLVRVRLSSLPAELETLWAAPEYSLTAKRALLFGRWDDCEDALPPAPRDAPASAVAPIDRIRHTAAGEARRAIETFVRTHARRGTTAGYAPPELRRLNRTRQSREAFAPYRRHEAP